MSAPREIGAGAMALRTSLILFLFVVVFTGLLSAAYLNTKDSIEASATEEKMKLVNEVLPPSDYDNALLEDGLNLPPTPALGLDEPSVAYRARKGGEAVAVILEAVAPDGYSGKIRLLLAIRADGQVAGVRVTQHRETPGLGDYVEPKKDKDKAHPWITQFNGLALAQVADGEWKVKKDGGRFTYHAGATVTPRAVVKAVHKAVKYANEHREQLFAPRGAQ